LEEIPCQLIGDLRDPLPMKPGHIERFDSEYERAGVCWIFMSLEPLTGWRDPALTERRRKREFAHWMRRLVEEHYPKAHKIGVVMDNLSTRSGAAFYESFPAQLARKVARRIEFVYSPVHGSWLNMVEVEISVMVRQCLGRRLPNLERLQREARGWCTERNRLGGSVDWRLRKEDARIKLRSLYPSVKV
jgi:DDE superfamily endonuclease